MSYGLSPADFSFPITQLEIIRIGLQLQEHNLAESCNSACLAWRLTARGVDIVEREGVGAPIEIKIINVSNSSNVVIGDDNTQNVDNSIQVILNAIDKVPASADQKSEAKQLFWQLLKLKAPKSLQTATPKFEEVVKSAQDAAVLVLVY